MIHRTLLLTGLAATALCGCTFDADGDGLSNREEIELGLDPHRSDMDADGLMDGEDPYPTEADIDRDHLTDAQELQIGTDPGNPDSDDDGYLDGDEDLEGHDPLDANDRIYTGHWPYNRYKDEQLGHEQFTGPLAIGNIFPRHRALDHHGDEVDLYDFGGSAQTYQYIVIVAQAAWCGPSRSTREWISGGEDHYGMEEDYGAIRDAVDQGRLQWISVLTQDSVGASPDLEGLEQWHQDFRHPHIPTLGDPDGEVEQAIVGALGGWPAAMLVDASTMRVVEQGFLLDELLASTLDYL